MYSLNQSQKVLIFLKGVAQLEGFQFHFRIEKLFFPKSIKRNIKVCRKNWISSIFS